MTDASASESALLVIVLSKCLVYLSNFFLSPSPLGVHSLWVRSYTVLKFSLIFIETNSYESRQGELSI